MVYRLENYKLNFSEGKKTIQGLFPKFNLGNTTSPYLNLNSTCSTSKFRTSQNIPRVSFKMITFLETLLPTTV